MNWQFWSEHPFLAFCALCFSAIIAYSALAFVFRIWNRVLRTINICARGWPPPHLDADGDWKPEPDLPSED